LDLIEWRCGWWLVGLTYYGGEAHAAWLPELELNAAPQKMSHRGRTPTKNRETASFVKVSKIQKYLVFKEEMHDRIYATCWTCGLIDD
jgi:hypothetical protein